MSTHVRKYSLGGKGVANAICQVCQGKFKNYEIKERWDGLKVCDKDWEPRHILDFYKPPRDNYPLQFVLKDTPTYGQVNAVLSADIGSPTLGTWALLPLNTELADGLNEFNTGTSTFQPSVGGAYAITAGIKASVSSQGMLGVAIYLNGSPYKVSDILNTPNNMTMLNQISTQITLLNTDLVTVRYFISGSASTISSANEATFINVRLVPSL